MIQIKRQPIPGQIPARIAVGVALLFFLHLLPPALAAQDGKNGERWVGTWTTANLARAPQSQPQPGQTAAAPQPFLNFNNQTLRQIVRTSIGGERVRVVLTNTFGTAPLAIGAARVALRDKGAAIVPQSDRALTFGGAAAIAIPAGAVIVSDPVNLGVASFADLAVDIYLPENTGSGTSPLTMHNVAVQTNYVSPAGNHAGAADMPVMTTTQNWFFLARVEVMAPEQVGVLVAFGDSITDGTRSTPDTNNRWPNHLAKRLTAQNIKMGVLNAGIAANRVLSEGTGVNALARFDRDVLVQPGVSHVVVLEGINDIRNSPMMTAADLIVGYRQLIERARTLGLKVYGATLLPCEGANNCTPETEVKRKAVNEWIRTSKAYDSVIDFDAVIRDPKSPSKMLPEYDSSDHLHPSDAGYQAMANAIDLELFKAGAAVLSRSPSR
ncbi:MAG: SGNH/GDSL hydrolase family protein [Luteitalea sp.]|nr:SGNH/GDSL hydrolase family protein [Luteitalea sp.]